MKRVFTSLIFILIFCAATFSQITESLPCPTISVTGPAGISQPDEPITFTANIGEEAKKYDVKYRWSVSNGTIIEGEETLSLKVLQENTKDFYAKGVTAKIEIIGLPKNCVNTASEKMAISLDPSAILFDELSVSPARIDKARLENFANEIQKNPTAQGYILERFNSGVSKKAVKAKSWKIFDHFTKIGFDKDRITILNGSASENSTQFFIVPAGATPPECDDCLKAESQ